MQIEASVPGGWEGRTSEEFERVTPGRRRDIGRHRPRPPRRGSRQSCARRRSPKTDREMDFHLIYSKEAIADLEAILDEITADNPAADSRFGISLYEHISLLKLFPRMGTPVRDRPQVRTLTHTRILAYYVVNMTRQSVENTSLTARYAFRSVMAIAATDTNHPPIKK